MQRAQAFTRMNTVLLEPYTNTHPPASSTRCCVRIYVSVSSRAPWMWSKQLKSIRTIKIINENDRRCFGGCWKKKLPFIYSLTKANESSSRRYVSCVYRYSAWINRKKEKKQAEERKKESVCGAIMGTDRIHSHLMASIVDSVRQRVAIDMLFAASERRRSTPSLPPPRLTIAMMMIILCASVRAPEK